MQTLFELELELPIRGSRDAARTLVSQLRAAILDGRLAAGSRMPPTRQSAAFFAVSRNTAIEIYERLLHDGLLVTRHGTGTFVAPQISRPARLRQDNATALDARLNPFWSSTQVTAAMGFWRDPSDPRQPGKATTAIDFRPALVDSRLFPFDVFRRVSAQQLRGLEKKPASFKSAQGNQGNFHLREAIRRHIALTRSVACESDDVLVTAGAQQAFDLLARILVRPGRDVVAIEDPGYPPMRVPFAAAGARIVPVAVDDEGIVIERIPAQASVICVCPSHQFPLGITLSPRRRKALIAFARERDAVIVEDDYDGEFRYGGSAVAALRTAEAGDTVFYVGTFSKCMLPSLRLGFIVAPDWSMRSLIAAKNGLDWHCPTPLQLGVAAFVADGHLTQHVRRMRAVYQRRRQLLLQVLRDDFGAWLEPVESFYGMHLAAFANVSLDLEAVAAALALRNVKLHTLDRYYLGTERRQGLVFGYGSVDLPQIRQGLTGLQAILSEAESAS